jgi:Copper transport outer membrane protein, MctB
MINFRFHLASLIAIFLALALGVVVGAGVIDRGVVDTLNGRLDSVESKANRIQGENDVLRGEVDELTDAIGAMECPAVDNTMLAEDVGIIAVRGVDDNPVKNTIAAATCGGGTVTGTLWLEDKWALTNDDDVAALAQAVGSSSKRKETVRTAAWKQLVERLQAPPPAGDLSTDFLTTLEQAGFVTFDPQGEEATQISQFPRRDASMLLVVGNDADVPSTDVVMPAATAFVAAGVPLVVAEVYAAGDDAPPRGEALVPLRDSLLGKSVSTVNDLDRPQGPTTAVLALAGLRLAQPQVGHYGIDEDGITLLPDVSQ